MTLEILYGAKKYGARNPFASNPRERRPRHFAGACPTAGDPGKKKRPPKRALPFFCRLAYRRPPFPL